MRGLVHADVEGQEGEPFDRRDAGRIRHVVAAVQTDTPPTVLTEFNATTSYCALLSKYVIAGT